jgi:hypothetical protein
MEKKGFLTKMKGLIIRFWYVLPLLFALFGFAWMWWLYYENVPVVLLDTVVVLHILSTIVLLISWGVLLANKKWWQCIVSFVATLVIVFILLYPFVTFLVFV